MDKQKVIMSLLTKTIGSYIYEVLFDHEACFEAATGKNHDLGEEYSRKFTTDELGSFIIIKNKACDCCENLKFVDSLGGIDATDEYEALEFYITDHDSMCGGE